MFCIYEIKTPEGSFNVVSLLPHEEVFRKALPSQAIVGILPANATDLNPVQFKPNREFIDFLHHVIVKYAPTIPDFQAEAKRQVDGWVYIIDGRVDNPEGNVGREDILGGFQVQSGEVIPASYLANPDHLLVSKRGLFQIEPLLEEKLLEEMRQLIANKRA